MRRKVIPKWLKKKVLESFKDESRIYLVEAALNRVEQFAQQRRIKRTHEYWVKHYKSITITPKIRELK